MTLYGELAARGLIAQVTAEAEIKDLINNGKATFYIGFDPTADSLHVGHFMALCLMKRLQMAGNKPIALIGGGTAMIGDPSGRTDMRQMMTPETIQHNCDCFKKQMSRFIDFSDGKALMVNNADWLMDLNYIDVLRIHVEITFEKYFQAMGMMVVSMLSMLCVCILNIILDPVLIFGIGPFPRLGIEGAAIATGIGQCSTLLIYILFYIFKKPPVTIRKHLLRPEKNVCIRLYGVGIPGALNMALPSLLISALNGILASISESGVIILGIYYKLQTFLYLSVNGMIQGMRPLMGYNYGAKEYRRVNKIYRLALTIAIGIMTAGTLLFMFTPETFMKMFTTQETTIAAGAAALRSISCGFIVSSVSVVSSGALEALGKGNESLVVSLLRYLVIIVPLAFVLSRFIGANGVWHSFWITETVTAFVAYGIYRKALRNK